MMHPWPVTFRTVLALVAAATLAVGCGSDAAAEPVEPPHSIHEPWQAEPFAVDQAVLDDAPRRRAATWTRQEFQFPVTLSLVAVDARGGSHVFLVSANQNTESDCFVEIAPSGQATTKSGGSIVWGCPSSSWLRVPSSLSARRRAATAPTRCRRSSAEPVPASRVSWSPSPTTGRSSRRSAASGWYAAWWPDATASTKVTAYDGAGDRDRHDAMTGGLAAADPPRHDDPDRGRPRRRTSSSAATASSARSRSRSGPRVPARTRSRSRSRCGRRASRTSSRSGFLRTEGLIDGPEILRFETGDPSEMNQPDDRITVRLARPFDASVVAGAALRRDGVLRDLRQGLARRGRRPLRADPGRPDRRPPRAARPAGPAPRRPEGVRRDRRPPRVGAVHAEGRAPRAARGRRPAQRARQARRVAGPREDDAAPRPDRHGQRPGQLRDRPEGGGRGRPDHRRGLGPVGPRDRGRRPARRDARRLPARRRLQRLRPRRADRPAGPAAAWASRRAAALGSGRTGSRTGP